MLSCIWASEIDASPYEVDSARSVFALSMGVDKSDKSKDHSGDRLSRLASGLLHIAAADDNADAQVALFKRSDFANYTSNIHNGKTTPKLFSSQVSGRSGRP